MVSNRIRKIKLLGALIIGLVSIVGIITVIYPFFNERETLKVEVQEKASENSVLSTRITTLNKTAEQVPQIKAFNDSLSVRFPSTSDIPGLVSSLANTASASGLGSGSITGLETSIPTLVAGTASSLPSSTTDTKTDKGPTDNTDTGSASSAAPAAGAAKSSSAGDLASMTVDLTVEGSPEQLATFVKNLSSGQGRAFLIKGFNIDSGADGASKLSLSMETFLYRTLPEPVKNPAPAAPAPADTKTK
jgi:Tfp pilus assembly protein PilO